MPGRSAREQQQLLALACGWPKFFLLQGLPGPPLCYSWMMLFPELDSDARVSVLHEIEQAEQVFLASPSAPEARGALAGGKVR